MGCARSEGSHPGGRATSVAVGRDVGRAVAVGCFVAVGGAGVGFGGGGGVGSVCATAGGACVGSFTTPAGILYPHRFAPVASSTCPLHGSIATSSRPRAASDGPKLCHDLPPSVDRKAPSSVANTSAPSLLAARLCMP